MYCTWFSTQIQYSTSTECAVLLHCSSMYFVRTVSTCSRTERVSFEPRRSVLWYYSESVDHNPVPAALSMWEAALAEIRKPGLERDGSRARTLSTVVLLYFPFPSLGTPPQPKEKTMLTHRR